MEEIIIKAFNYGFAAVMCLLMFYKLLPKIDKMDKTIDDLKDVIDNHLVHAIGKLITEVKRLNGK